VYAGSPSTLTAPVDAVLGGNVRNAAGAVAVGQLFPIGTPLILQLVQLFLMTD